VISEQQGRQGIPRIVRALTQTYGEPPRLSEGDALDLAVHVILRDGISERAAETALARLRQDFVDWNEVRVSTPHQVVRALGDPQGGLERARAILGLLRAVFRRQNEMSMAFLREAGAAEARSFFETVPELGPVLSAKMLMLVLGHPSVIVTPEVARVCQRLELVREDYDKSQIERRLERLVARNLMPELYHVFQEHARRACLAQDPRCKGCPILKQCAFGREAIKTARQARQSSAKGK
jgi:endonuclease-3